MANENDKVKKPKAPEKESTKKETSPFVERLLANSSEKKQEIISKVDKMGHTTIDNAYAFNKILQIINVTDKIRTERQAKRFNKNSTKINTEYDVIVADDKLSKRLMATLKNIKNLSDAEAKNIHNGFVSNNYDEVKEILESNTKFIADCNEIIRILSGAVSVKAKNGTYQENSMFTEIIKYLGTDNVKTMISEIEKESQKKDKEKEKAA